MWMQFEKLTKETATRPAFALPPSQAAGGAVNAWAGLRSAGVVCGSSARRLGPWDSYRSALIFLRPRPPSIQLTP
jgi:hypothetical protein